MSNRQESLITINGRELSVGEAMAVRVAVEAFAAQLADEGLGTDEMGKQLAAGYMRNINTIRSKMYGT